MIPPRTMHFLRRITRNVFRWVAVFAVCVLVLNLIQKKYDPIDQADPGIHIFIFFLLILVVLILVSITLRTENWVWPKLRSSKCRKCKCNILPNKDWTCGYCGKRNAKQPLIGRCEHCGERPASVICPRCEQVIRLGLKWISKENHATIYKHVPQPVKPQPVVKISPVVGLREEEKLLHAETSKIKAQTGKIRATIDMKQASEELEGTDTSIERLEHRIRKELALQSALPDIRKKLREEMAEKYADDPEKLDTVYGNIDFLIEEKNNQNM